MVGFGFGLGAEGSDLVRIPPAAKPCHHVASTSEYEELVGRAVIKELCRTIKGDFLQVIIPRLGGALQATGSFHSLLRFSWHSQLRAVPKHIRPMTLKPIDFSPIAKQKERNICNT